MSGGHPILGTRVGEGGGGWGRDNYLGGGARDPVTTSVLTKIRNGMEHVYFPERVISSSPIVV